MRDIFTLSLLTVFLISCDTDRKEKISYFGGEIINPNSRYIILYKNDDLIDSISLDKDNRFLVALNDVDDGLYHFEHQPEYQYVFIERGDSILIRLNTLDFDESLVFTGKGSEKNNFLIDMFLVNEDEERLIYDYYKLDAGDFRKKMDSLMMMKLEQYENLTTDYTLSDDAKNITRASIDYAHYTSMEIYPYMNKNRNRLSEIQKLPEDFYKYRTNLDANDCRLNYFRPYFNYMVMKMNNLSYVYCMERFKNDTVNIDKTFHYHAHKLHLIDSMIEDPYLKDNVYRNTVYTYLLEDHDPENNKIFIEKFNTYSGNNRYLDEINELYKSIQNLRSGKPLPLLYLVDIEGKNKAMGSIFNHTKRVFYFWSSGQKNHMKNINKKVLELQDRYPSYQFIGINIDDNQEKWVKYVKAYNLNAGHQFRAKDFKQLGEKLIIENLNKGIIVRKNGTIIDAFANIYERNFEYTLSTNMGRQQKKIY